MKQRDRTKEIQECLAVIKVMNALADFMTKHGVCGGKLESQEVSTCERT
jgi:hypothetical protein